MLRSFRSLSFIASNSDEAQASREELAARYGSVEPAQADVIVALGGDGFMLQTLHDTMNSGKLVYGMNRGSVGFLMNDYSVENLRERIAAAVENDFHPLKMTTTNADGSSSIALAINEVSLLRQSYQAAKLRVLIDGKVRLDELICDGLMVATPVGSTAYNLSAHGPILPLEAPLLALTPVSPFRPRRWRGASASPNTGDRRDDRAGAGETAGQRGGRSYRGQVGPARAHRPVGGHDRAHSLRSRPLVVGSHSRRTVFRLREISAWP